MDGIARKRDRCVEEGLPVEHWWLELSFAAFVGITEVFIDNYDTLEFLVN